MADNSTPHMAGVYDKKVRETLPYYDCLIKEAVEIVKTINPSPNVWLDTGCGTGNIIDEALNQFDKTKFFIGDPSQEMLDIAVSKNINNKRVKSIGAYATQDLKNIDIDKPEVITAIQCHHYVDEKTRECAIKVCYDLLQDGGVFVTSENISPATQEGIDYAKKRSVNFQITQGRTFEEASAHTNRFGVNYFPITVETYIKLLKKCGFRIVELLWVSQSLAGFYCIK